MDLVLHGLTGVLLVSIIFELFDILIFTPTIIIILFIVWLLGAYPDLVGYWDGLIRGKEYRWNGMYLQSHEATHGIWKILSYIPFVWLHIKIDKFWHDVDGGWKSWGVITDILIWCILIGIFIIMVII